MRAGPVSCDGVRRPPGPLLARLQWPAGVQRRSQDPEDAVQLVGRENVDIHPGRRFVAGFSGTSDSIPGAIGPEEISVRLVRSRPAHSRRTGAHRRRTMRRIAIFALLAAAPSTAQNTFRGNNAHTGVYQGAGPKQLGEVKWAFKAGGPIVTSPAIADGVVYFGAMDGHLHAVVQDTGQEKWKFKSDAHRFVPGRRERQGLLRERRRERLRGRRADRRVAME